MSKVRQVFYLVSGLIAGLLPVLMFFKVLSSDQAASFAEIVGSFGSLIGAGGALTAGVIVGKQRNNGTFDDVSPIDQVINNLPLVVQKANDAATDLDRLKQAATDVLGNVPVYGAEAQAILNGLRF